MICTTFPSETTLTLIATRTLPVTVFRPLAETWGRIGRITSAGADGTVSAGAGSGGGVMDGSSRTAVGGDSVLAPASAGDDDLLGVGFAGLRSHNKPAITTATASTSNGM